MKTIVITGGTDGIGRALAQHAYDQGATVAIIGRDAAKGEAFAGLGERAHFIRADLSLREENRRVLAELEARFDAVDALVLCARYFNSHRRETPDGFEHSFALEYLSRYHLSHGLLGLLERADAPLIVNVSGPGSRKPEIRWGDPGFTRGYSGVEAQFHAGRANDLLGLSFAATHPGIRTRYVLVHPGLVATSFAGDYDPETAGVVAQMKRQARSVEEGIAPIIPLLDAPPADALSAFALGRRVDPRTTPGDDAAADRLHRLTETLLGA